MAMNLKPGQAVNVPAGLLAKAAVDDADLLTRMSGTVRREDIDAFIAKVGPNWEMQFTEQLDGNWRMFHPGVNCKTCKGRRAIERIVRDEGEYFETERVECPDCV